MFYGFCFFEVSRSDGEHCLNCWNRNHFILISWLNLHPVSSVTILYNTGPNLSFLEWIIQIFCFETKIAFQRFQVESKFTLVNRIQKKIFFAFVMPKTSHQTEHRIKAQSSSFSSKIFRITRLGFYSVLFKVWIFVSKAW